MEQHEILPLDEAGEHSTILQNPPRMGLKLCIMDYSVRRELVSGFTN